jgi:UPF0271 protein
MKTTDLNCDMGEGCGNDAELMMYISSANIACGYHAGDRETMRETVRLAVENGVAIGAHPGYRDRDNFGRTSMKLSRREVVDLIHEQLTSLDTICKERGARINHMKPHGALYNQAAVDADLADAIAAAVRDYDPNLVLYGLSGSSMISRAEALGLRTASEVFADRTYSKDGTLTPRTEAKAMIEDVDESIRQVTQMIEAGSVTARSGETIPIRAETICIHGDGPHAVRFARAIREALRARDVVIASISR